MKTAPSLPGCYRRHRYRQSFLTNGWWNLRATDIDVIGVGLDIDRGRDQQQHVPEAGAVKVIAALVDPRQPGSGR